ncbi:histidine ammonia-lyase [bacterium SCSIO 12741]|nr:histidine ammonia-lyase [bacterium SCSIO 12741]
MKVHHLISSERLTLTTIRDIIQSERLLHLSDSARDKIVACREYLDRKMDTQEEPIYGINTGFGSLYNHSISREDLSQLQKNLVMSHACGTGDQVDPEVVKLMLLLKIQGLSYGHSGVQLITVERLIDFYNHNVLPVVFEQGSLGASGDLAPLAHLALPLLGLGEVTFEGKIQPAADVLESIGWEPIELQSKEGLALLNGTQFMSALAVWNLLKATELSEKADKIAALSLDAFDGRPEPFDPSLHHIRNHQGQIETATRIRDYLIGSEIIEQSKTHVQDPYSFRCVPQVHGASKDALKYILSVVENEINAVTDNPTIFPEEDKIISGGNFHGQPLALVLDQMSIACAELASISERRVYKMISGQRGLPAFLVAEPGLNSGFMIPQYTAASIVSQNKQLCTPSSVDTIDSSNGQEDHVSMGANAATKCQRVVKNLQRVLGIELLNAAQALEFRRPLKSSPELEEWVSVYRQTVPFVEKDTELHVLIKKSIAFLD